MDCIYCWYLNETFHTDIAILLTASEFLHGVRVVLFFLFHQEQTWLNGSLTQAAIHRHYSTNPFFYILIWALPLSNSIHRACTLTPASSPLQTSLIFPSWQRRQKCNRAEGKRDMGGGEDIQEAHAAAGELFCFPSEACLVHNLSPCNADPGPQW